MSITEICILVLAAGCALAFLYFVFTDGGDNGPRAG